jgi:hypothetical protein
MKTNEKPMKRVKRLHTSCQQTGQLRKTTEIIELTMKTKKNNQFNQTTIDCWKNVRDSTNP